MDKIYLRKARKNDMKLLFEWANDPVVRVNSFTNERISLEDHKEWFKNKMNSNNSEIYILCYNDQPAGQIRIDIENKKGIINYSISKNFRGCGLGSIIIDLINDKAKKDLPKLEKLIGKVKEENIGSIKCFEKNDYNKREKEDIFIFEKEL